jgi:hypothetical protein
MDTRNIARLWGVGLVLILTACSGAPSPPPENRPVPPPVSLGPPPISLVHDPWILGRANTIILVRVVALAEVHPYPWRPDLTDTDATLLVRKSWKGPFSAGRVLHTVTGVVLCASPVNDCEPYGFQFADKNKEFLIMAGADTERDRTNVLFVRRDWVWPAAESQALMAALEQAVIDSQPTDRAGYVARVQKEMAAAKDVEAKLQAALSNHAPEAEIDDLSTQLWGHRENAARWRSVLQQLADR